MIVIRRLGPGDDDVLSRVAADVFDDPVDKAAAVEFVRDPRHHIVVAIDDGTVIGFVSAVHYVHPDERRPELWLNEVSVAATHHRLGIARRMMAEMLDIGRELGCTEGWVLTDEDNAAALALYEAAGGRAQRKVVMFTFDLP